MPQWDSLAAFGRELVGLEGDLTVKEVRQITRTQGLAAQSIAAQHARSDLGADGAFSGWRRGNPIPLTTQLRPASDGNTLLTPGRSAGQWTTAEFGRNTKAGPRLVGPRLTRTGRISKARQRRYNGVTQPKHTATEAQAEMEKRLPKIADKAVLVVTRKRFTVT